MNTTKNPKWYVGVKCPSYRCDIFKTCTEPTQKTHGHLYGFCFGGYRTQWEAIRVAMYQGFGIDTPQPRNRLTRLHLEDPTPNQAYKIFGMK